MWLVATQTELSIELGNYSYVLVWALVFG